MTRPILRFLVAALLLGACAEDKAAEKPKDVDPDVAAIKDRIAADSMDWRLRVQLAEELRRKNRLEDAGNAAEKAFQLAPSPAIEARLVMAKVYAAADRSAAAINLVKDAERQKRAGEPVDEVKIAEVYAILGDVSAVFRWLQRAVPANSPNLATLSTNADFGNVHSDPRWSAITGGAK